MDTLTRHNASGNPVLLLLFTAISVFVMMIEATSLTSPNGALLPF